MSIAAEILILQYSVRARWKGLVISVILSPRTVLYCHFWMSYVWNKIRNIHEIEGSRRKNHENSSSSHIYCGKSIYTRVLIFLVVLDIGLVHLKQLLYFMNHKNSEMLQKPRIQPFLDKKLKKILAKSQNYPGTPV